MSRRTAPGKWLLAATAVAAVAAGCGSRDAAEGPGAAPPADGTVAVKEIPGVGQALVDAAGMTLYSADQEADGSIKCTDDCLGFWFPAAADNGTPGAVPGLAVVRRPDTGKDQLTFQGKPLYTFKLDKAAGQHSGHNLTDDFAGTTFTWRAATTTATTDAPPASSGPGDYGY